MKCSSVEVPLVAALEFTSSVIKAYRQGFKWPRSTVIPGIIVLCLGGIIVVRRATDKSSWRDTDPVILGEQQLSEFQPGAVEEL